MLLTTTFNRQLWKLDSFETVSYDKESKDLFIHYLDQTVLQFYSVPENVLFQFIIDTDKESFIQQILIPNYLIERNEKLRTN